MPTTEASALGATLVLALRPAEVRHFESTVTMGPLHWSRLPVDLQSLALSRPLALRHLLAVEAPWLQCPTQILLFLV